MNRREFTLSCLGALAVAGASGAGLLPDSAAAQQAQPQPAPARTGETPHIAFLLFDGMTALDMIGPATVLANSGFTVDYVWRNADPVYAETTSDKRLGLLPTATFGDVGAADILCVPGTSNPYAQIVQPDIIEWVAHVGQRATWVTSVCTGSFLLGAAGLLKGYRATAHWTMVDELAYFGATPVRERVVRDRNRVIGAGVSSGIDFGLVLLALIHGEQTARMWQLIMEYDPHPPFDSGSPHTADQKLVEAVRSNSSGNRVPYARKSLEDAAKRLGVTVAG